MRIESLVATQTFKESEIFEQNSLAARSAFT